MSTNGDREELQALAEDLVRRAKAEGSTWSARAGCSHRADQDGLETALNAELTEHPDYGRHDRAGRGSGNSRNGTRTKTMLTELGPADVDVPRDRAGSFAPVILKKG
jgi:putative transposase